MRRSKFEDRSLELAWSLWAELGVSTWTRRHSDTFIDVEPLILFTARLGDLDPRLRDESADWCIRYGEYVNKVRLKNLLKSRPEYGRSFDRYASTVNEHGGFSWPAAKAARPLRGFQPSGRSRLEDPGRPALIGLRLRALFGTGARAEVLRAFLSSPQSAMSAADLAAATNYGKRNIADALDSLRLGRVLKRVHVRNASSYLLAAGSELSALVGPLPERFPAWNRILPLVADLRQIVGSDPDKPISRIALANRFLRANADDLLHEVLGPAPPEVVGPDEWDRFEQWAIGVVSAQARV